MPPPSVPFDALIFDLDGTLVATDRFWVAAAQEGARRAFRELGIERKLPAAREWMGMVGMPLDEGFACVFPDLESAARAHLMQRCVEEENAALARGGAALVPGAAELLDYLKSSGSKLGIASNCGKDYLRAMLEGLGLERWIDAARCLDSPGVSDKASMIGDLLELFETRNALMIGDRIMDRDAAYENGLPHVHVERGYAEGFEEVACEAVVAGLAQVREVLSGRWNFVAQTLARAGCASAEKGCASLGIGGRVAAGKSLFARDAARLVEVRGRRTCVVEIERFRLANPQPLGAAQGRPRAADRYAVETLVAGLLEPHAAGRDVSLPAAAGRGAVELAADTLLILEGADLCDPDIAAHLDALLYLEVSEGLSLRRLVGMDGGGTARLVQARRELFPRQRAFEAGARHAERVTRVDAESVFGPGGSVSSEP